MPKSENLLERLADGVILCDGGFTFELEKRGYVKSGAWTPECCVEHPEAVKQLHREFLRSGSDVMQTFTFYCSEDKLDNRGHNMGKKYGVNEINLAACKIARQVADEGDGIMVAGGVSQTPTYLSTRNKELVQNEFRKQTKNFVGQVDNISAEYIEHIE